MLNDKGLKKLHTAMQGNEALGREVIQLLAFTTNDHEDLRKILAAVKGSERRTAYETLKPYLSFTPKPLDEYIAMNADYAERHQLPTLNSETGALTEFKVGSVGLKEAATDALYDGGIALLTCRRCTFEQVCRGETPVDARIKAVEAGWKYEIAIERWLCPDCNESAKEN